MRVVDVCGRKPNTGLQPQLPKEVAANMITAEENIQEDLKKQSLKKQKKRLCRIKQQGRSYEMLAFLSPSLILLLWEIFQESALSM